MGVFTSVICAHVQLDGVAMYKRQGDESTSIEATQTTTSATATPTATSQPDEVYEAVNITLDGQIFPPNIHIEGVSSTSTTDFTIDCIGCSIIGDFSLSAGDNNFPFHKFEEPSDVEERGNGSTFDFGDIWVAATCDYLNATFEVAVNLTASNTTNGFSIPLYTQTKSLEVGILTLSATLSTELYGWVNTSNDVNLTYGFQFGVPAYSEIIIDINHPENSTSLGFLVPIPLNSTRSDLDIAIEVGFRPSVTFVVALGDPSIIGASVSLDVGLDIPKLDLDIKQVHNVTANCDPAAPSLLSGSKRDNTVYENLTLVAPSLGLDLFEVFNESANFLGAKLSGQQPFNQSFFWDLPTQCLFFDAAKKTLGPASATKSAQISRAADPPVFPLATTFMAVAAVAGFMTMMM
ncbi:MAG: hypothetical protein ASARMPREDX12_005261 [Alectoria sarmentosa]|nr:MAG: hypothetical protein ASARMPREDX12_005261 [Alectoria sarmentosa]